MIKKVTVYNHAGQALELELRAPEKSGLYVKKIEGLGPVNGTIVVTEPASTDGGYFNSGRIGKRNIVFTFGFMWAPTIEDSRLKTYEFFPIKKSIKMVFETDRRTVEINGFTESNTPDIFSSNEGCQVSVICPDPFFKSVADAGGSTVQSFGSIEPLFEFAFDSYGVDSGYYFSIEESSPEEFSRLASDQYMVVDYKGDHDTGLTMELYAAGPISRPVIYNVDTNEMLRLDTELSSGDTVTVRTHHRQKAIHKVTLNGATTNLMSALDRKSTWLRLSTGKNRFLVSADSGAENCIWKLSYDVLYEGI